MKNIIKGFLLFIISLFISLDVSFAVNPTFELKTVNWVYTSSNAGYFDVVLKHTNYPAADFVYKGATYVLQIDTMAIGTNYTFSKDVTSDYSFYENRIPNSNVGGIVRSGNTLKFQTTLFPVGFEPPISHTTGTLVTRIKFINSNLYSSSCILIDAYYNWVTSGTGFITEIGAMVDGVFTMLPNNENIFLGGLCQSFHTCCAFIPPIPPVRISPPNNSINVSAPFSFTWYRGDPCFGCSAYRIQIATDASFNSIKVDSTFANSSDSVVFITDKLNYNSVYYWRVRKSAGSAMGAYTENWTFTTASAISCNLKIIPEGYNTLPTHPAFGVKAYLRNNTSPFALIDSADASVPDSSWSGLFNFTNAESGNYYIVVKHFNTIETWSSSGGESLTKGITNNYDFSSSISQAYGNNLKLVEDAYCIFSGDVNQNGYVDGDDVLIINNELANFAAGYLPSDINGDGFCDLTDLLIAYDNSVNFVHVIRP